VVLGADEAVSGGALAGDVGLEGDQGGLHFNDINVFFEKGDASFWWDL